MLACVFLNGLIAYPLIGGWQRWADDNIVNAGAGKTAFVTTSIVVAILLAGYVLAALSTFLRRMLEGQWSGFLRDWSVSAQNRRREKIARDRSAEGREVADLAYAPDWNRKIADAWADGRKDHPGVAWTPPDPTDCRGPSWVTRRSSPFCSTTRRTCAWSIKARPSTCGTARSWRPRSIARIGDELGVPTPVHHFIYAVLKLYAGGS